MGKKSKKGKGNSKGTLQSWSTDVGTVTSSAVATPYVPSDRLRTSGSRWATREEFESAVERVPLSSDMSLMQGGIVLGSDRKGLLMDVNDTHTMVIGSTGSQKSRRVIMPTLFNLARAGENMIVADCMGEI